jgi:hypothetical protein
MEGLPMTKRLAPYGSDNHAGDVAKVGKTKSPWSLAARMPSPELVAKVGKQASPLSLAARMPSPDIVAKVGKLPVSRNLAARMPSPEIAAKVGEGISAIRNHRVVRLSRQG